MTSLCDTDHVAQSFVLLQMPEGVVAPTGAMFSAAAHAQLPDMRLQVLQGACKLQTGYVEWVIVLLCAGVCLFPSVLWRVSDCEYHALCANLSQFACEYDFPCVNQSQLHVSIMLHMQTIPNLHHFLPFFLLSHSFF